MVWALRATRRCLTEDLELKPDDASALQDLTVIKSEHLIVRDFLTQRTVYPDGREGSVKVLGDQYKELKSSRHRGVTLHEERPDDQAMKHPDVSWDGVVWLLAAKYRKEGDQHDAFSDFERMGVSALLPTALDYEELFAAVRREAREALAEDLHSDVRSTLAAAQANPGTMQRMVSNPFAGFAVKVFSDHGYRILVVPTLTRDRRPVSSEVQELLVQVTFKGHPLGNLESPDPRTVADITGYELEAGEFALCIRTKFP